MKKSFSDKKLISLLEKNSIPSNFSKDENGYLMAIDFNLEKLLNEINSNEVNSIVFHIQEKLSFLKEYGYEIEEIIYVPHLLKPGKIYVSFLKPITDNCDLGDVLYEKK